MCNNKYAASHNVCAKKETVMLEILGLRQQELLSQLLKHKSGATVDELATKLEITRNAIRQHLAVLEKDGFVTLGTSRPTGGRPEQLYILTEAGRELFPRHYSWFAQLIVESIKQESGEKGLKQRMEAMGELVAKDLRQQQAALEGQQQKVEKLATIMKQLGYDTENAKIVNGIPVIEANNCIFHNLAIKNPEICQFDIALMSTFTDSSINHEECMASGGNVCRFKFTTK